MLTFWIRLASAYHRNTSVLSNPFPLEIRFVVLQYFVIIVVSGRATVKQQFSMMESRSFPSVSTYYLIMYKDLLGNRKSLNNFSFSTIFSLITQSVNRLKPAMISPQNCGKICCERFRRSRRRLMNKERTLTLSTCGFIHPSGAKSKTCINGS